MAVDTIIFTQISKNETKWWLGEKAEAARTNRGGGSLSQQRYHLPASYITTHTTTIPTTTNTTTAPTTTTTTTTPITTVITISMYYYCYFF